jgi:hypothetical protein
MMKTDGFKDWWLYSMKHGMPGIIGTTKAPVGSKVWQTMEAAVAAVASDFSAVVNYEDLGGVKAIDKVDFSADGELPMPKLVDRCDRGLAANWRGGDLSTISATAGDAGQGASVQQGESDNLEEDSCQLISETCQLQLDPLVLKIVFGEGVEAKAYFSFGGAGKVDTNKEMAIDTGLYNMGFPQHAHELATRYGRQVPEGEDDTIIVKSAGAVEMPGQPGEDAFDSTRQFADAIANEDPKQKALITAATREAKVLKPIRDRLTFILSLGNEESMAKELARFRGDLPSLLLKVNANPATAKELEKLLAAAMINGLAAEKEATK